MWRIITTGPSGTIAATRVPSPAHGASGTTARPGVSIFDPAGPRPDARIGATMAAPRRIGILTGGGDVPGLNSVIKSVVYRATDLGYEVLGIRRGWEGLTHQRRGSELDPEYVRVL